MMLKIISIQGEIIIKGLSVLLFLLFGGCSHEQASKLPLPQAEEAIYSAVQPRKFSKGEAHFIRHCADCHGWEGRGNGPVAEFTRVKPPVLQDRELLADNSEEKFVDLVLYGRTPEISLTKKAVPQTDTEISELLAHLRKLPTIDWDKTIAGQDDYDKLCISCHGLYGGGDGALASQLPVALPDLSASDYQSQHSDKELKQIIAKGKNAMPGTEDILNPEDIDNVVAFVRLLSPGYVIYDRYCAGCHGSNGLPIDYIVLNREDDLDVYGDINIPALDGAYFEAHNDQQLRKSIQHMLVENSPTMPHFSEQLKPGEVREIFRYLNSLIAVSS